MISGYYEKINSYLDKNDDDVLLINDDINLMYQRQLQKSADYLQTLKKNSQKIQQLIMENDKLKHQNSLHLKSIQMHLKKQIELKLTIANLQEQIQILNDQLTNFQLKISNNQIDLGHGISSKQHFKLMEKLQNCIAQNQILRCQNRRFYDQEYNKQKNYRHIELKFRQTIRTLQQTIKSLQTELQYQTEKASLLQKIQAQNNILKSQNKRLHFAMNTKLDQYETKMNTLISELQNHRYGKSLIAQKYEELTEVIQVIEKIRHQFKSKKKSLQYEQQEKQLLNQIQFNSNFLKIDDRIKISPKNLDQSKTKQKLFKKQITKNINAQ